VKTTQSQNCPLCGAEAVFYFVDYEERKYFKCPRCGKFQITRRGEARLSDAPTAWREQLSERAKHTPDEHLMVISVPPATTDGDGRTTEALTSDYLPKSGLPL
jgi:predicted RNA-binding Zn-ribbon protein involved in translation (DUF1610 family)